MPATGRETSFAAASTEPWARVAVGVLGVAWGAGQFAPLLLVYRDDVGLGSGTVAALWIVYVVGLVPAMLLGGYASDRLGRRSLVRLALVLSMLSSLSLIAGAAFEPLLFLGRLLAGLASGAALGPATAWIKEASTGTSEAAAARRAAVAISVGFGGGPLIAGCLAAWAPAPDAIPYVVHVILLAAIIPFAWGTSEPARPAGPGADEQRGSGIAAALRHAEFTRNVLPTAPWVFGTASTITAVLPELVIHGGAGPAPAGAVSALTLGAGVVVQPVGRRIEKSHPGKSMHVGLLVTAFGFALGILTVGVGEAFLLFPGAVVFGSAYGLILVAGLTQVEILAAPRDLASLTAGFYCLTYLGFTAPLFFTLAEKVVSDTVIMAVGGLVALATIPILVPRRSHPSDGPSGPSPSGELAGAAR